MNILHLNNGTAVSAKNPALAEDVVSKAVTFVAGTTGSVAQHTLFTVTGDVRAKVFAFCTSDLTSGGAATISVGTAGDVDKIIAVTTATNIDNTEVWTTSTGGTPTAEVGKDDNSYFFVNGGADITYDVLSSTITGGILTFYCSFQPLSDGATVVAA